MAEPTLDATAKGASSNSYLTRAAAQLYFDTRIAADVANWTAATDADKDRALIAATYRLDQETYHGTVTTLDQALKWPRIGLVDDDGRLVDQDTVPAVIQRACCELALAFLNSETSLSDTGLEGFREVTVGPLSVTPRVERPAGDLPEQVKRFLRPYWLDVGGLVRPVIRA